MTLNDQITPELRRIAGELEKLRALKIHVGVQGGVATGEQGGQGHDVDTPASILTIAGVHEYGMTIKARRVKHLAIPISPKSKGKSPREFNNLFFIRTEEGELYGVQEKGKDQLEFLFWLPKSVYIPERSFIRAGYDNGKGTIERAIQQAMSNIIREGWTAQQAAEFVGLYAVKVVKEYFTSGNLKPKSDATLAASPNKTTPLIDSGRLRNSITFRVEGG